MHVQSAAFIRLPYRIQNILRLTTLVLLLWMTLLSCWYIYYCFTVGSDQNKTFLVNNKLKLIVLKTHLLTGLYGARVSLDKSCFY